MMPTIRISDEVFSELKRRAEAFVDTPDSVLRKILGLTDAAKTSRTGGLLPQLRSGALSAGDKLVWHRKRAGQTHQATVLADGCVRLPDGRVAESLSKACALLSEGKSYNGWEEWRRASDDVLLNELR
ncbi:hypothetical protein [Amycolatopsis sp. GM8]|uniref:restriction system modified-DNA reader domain-containing protein n=1 Tax=Amycolatopsis sp. GM8 TaxID=2896530 RepID=UPI001F298F13|nr:hypothetical protein [Amycolatopsis sp. GM8]